MDFSSSNHSVCVNDSTRKIILALAVAIFLNRDIKGINLIRTLYYIPSLFGGSVAIAICGD